MSKSVRFSSFVPFYSMVLLGAILLALFGSKIISTAVESAPLEGRRIIVIDAGHGGEDGGATSCSGVLESGINLQIALRLEPLLQLLGYETVMVRTTDTAIHTQGDTISSRKMSDLKARVQLANNTENAVLISIHQNYFSDSRYSGAQVLYADAEESKELAVMLQDLLVRTVNPGSNRQVKKATGIYLMEHVSCPAILVECGFLSNPEEEAKLRSKEYQMAICCVIGAALANHFTA